MEKTQEQAVIITGVVPASEGDCWTRVDFLLPSHHES
jgi:hypothetical protein